MKNLNLIMALILCSFLDASAQSTNGLIAHWNFNGNTNDVYGTHNGTPHGLSPATGKAGLSNTAYYFSDTISYIDVPYQADLNIPDYSISAIVKPTGYYAGICHDNVVLVRGTFYQNGNYGLSFTENAYDVDCQHVDTSKYVFAGYVGTQWYINPHVSQQYSPNIISNTWYCVTITYTPSVTKVYVNGALKSTSALLSGTLGSSMEGITIGRYLIDPSYPYQFNGYIDDIMLYNRVLSDSEINNYCTSFSGDNPIDTNDHNDTGLHVQTVTHPQINLFPNPNNGNFKIAGFVNTNTEGHIFIMNTIGQTVYKEAVIPVNNYFEKEINLPGDLPRGVYIISYTSGNYTWNRKMLIRE